MGFTTFNLSLNTQFVSIVGPIAATAPAVTIVLAYFFLKERVVSNQKLGIIAILAGLILISLLTSSDCLEDFYLLRFFEETSREMKYSCSTNPKAPFLAENSSNFFTPSGFKSGDFNCEMARDLLHVFRF